MQRFALVGATVAALALSVLMPAALAATKKPVSAAGGQMICDGLTGCYIIPTVGPAAGAAWLADCSGNLSSGPLRCVATPPIDVQGGTQIWVNSAVVCQVYVRTGDFTTQLVYESTHGKITIQQSGTTLTMTAHCPGSPG